MYKMSEKYKIFKNIIIVSPFGIALHSISVPMVRAGYCSHWSFMDRTGTGLVFFFSISCLWISSTHANLWIGFLPFIQMNIQTHIHILFQKCFSAKIHFSIMMCEAFTAHKKKMNAGGIWRRHWWYLIYSQEFTIDNPNQTFMMR